MPRDKERADASCCKDIYCSVCGGYIRTDCHPSRTTDVHSALIACVTVLAERLRALEAGNR